MNNTDFISIAFGLMALFVTGIGIFVTVVLTSISHDQTRDAQKFVYVQQFETTFFNLLNAQRVIVNSMDLRKKKDRSVITAVGSDCFKTFHKYFLKAIEDRRLEIHKAMFPELFNVLPIQKYALSHDKVMLAFVKIFLNHQGDLAHYFNNLFLILKFVDDCKSVNDQYKYMEFVKGQLSAHELLLLYYYGLTEIGKAYKLLIEKYDLLQYLDEAYIVPSNDRPNESYYQIRTPKRTVVL